MDKRGAAPRALLVTGIGGFALAMSTSAVSAAYGAAPAGSQVKPLIVSVAAKAPATFSVAGAGWGHGVGLSQYGAFGMAKEGHSAKEIIEHYFTGVQAVAYPDTRELRVNIGHRLTSVRIRGVALGRGGGAMVMRLDARAGVAIPVGTNVRFKASGKRVRVTLKAGSAKAHSLGTAKIARLNWAGTRSNGGAGITPSAVVIGKNGADYRWGSPYRYGSVDVGNVGGKLELVNSVRIHDEYLFGIAEVPASWPNAALQAQAIAARSYALSRKSVRPSCRCQSDDGSGPFYDQTFVGYQRETSAMGSRWRAAVSATATSATTGRSALYMGDPIPAFYFSSSGGRTQNSEDVWGGKLPWARSVDDHWSLNPKYNDSGNAAWRKSLSQANLDAAFGLSHISRVVVVSRSAGGTVKSVTAYTTSGTQATISGTALVSRLGLRSKWVQTIS